MFTGLVLLCTIELECYSQASFKLFPSKEVCMEDARRYFNAQLEDPNIIAGSYDCFDWGTPA